MTDCLTDLASEIDPTRMDEVRISIDEFIEAYNSRLAELIDIRTPTEIRVWQTNSGMKIPANELPDRLNELPRDKLLVVACPMTDRSNMARTYLHGQGFQVKYLQGGLLGLMAHLKGGHAKQIHLQTR